MIRALFLNLHYFHKTTLVAFSAASVVLLGSAAHAQYVTVGPPGGDWDIAGRVVGFDGDFLRLQTEDGVATVRYNAAWCRGFSCPDPVNDAPVLRMAGSKLAGDVIIPTMVQAFATARGLTPQRYDFGAQTTAFALVDDAGVPALNIMFQATATASAMSEVLSFDADIIIADRALTRRELDRAARGGLGDVSDPSRMRLLALTALTPVVAEGNDVSEVTLTQLAQIFSGEITNWSEIGGADMPISVHIVAPRAGQGRALLDRLLVPTGSDLAPSATVHDDYQALAVAIARDTAAIGLMPKINANDLQEISLLDACGGTWADDALTIRTEDHPLVLPLYLHLPRYRLPSIAQSFISEMSSGPVDAALESAAVITHSPRALPPALRLTIDATSEVVAPDGDPLAGLQRITLTFRFEDGSRVLDGPSRLHVRLLADLIRAGDYADRQIVLAGFSDGVGTAGRNLALSRARAREVRKALRDALGGQFPEGVEIGIVALGEARQIACDASVWGRRINRRVEVWTGPRVRTY